jgi:hypothetical protein
MNGGAVRMLAMVIVTFLELLVASTVCSGLVVPTGTLPKLRLRGVTLRCAFPFAASAANTGADANTPMVKSRVRILKRDDFVRDMAFLPRNTDHGSTSVVMYAPSLPAPREFDRLDRAR